ncbi:MAG TPA: hypothetical protein VH475_15050 [Tepidisphaeraceae bacterium]|jgi:hypothetical protein
MDEPLSPIDHQTVDRATAPLDYEAPPAPLPARVVFSHLAASVICGLCAASFLAFLVGFALSARRRSMDSTDWIAALGLVSVIAALTIAAVWNVRRLNARRRHIVRVPRKSP